ncbi:MAG: RNA-binding protein [Luteitalea sp.]|nr:RNA-binding protein [Luteitalea sp.]
MTDSKSMDARSASVRLDVWLDVTCLCKTRSEAQRACKGGKVHVNGVRAKPHREIRAGERIAITRGDGRRQQVVVRATSDVHLPKAEARELYEDVTPPPTPEETVVRDLLRAARSQTPAVAPDRRERRRLRRAKERG